MRSFYSVMLLVGSVSAFANGVVAMVHGDETRAVAFVALAIGLDLKSSLDDKAKPHGANVEVQK